MRNNFKDIFHNMCEDKTPKIKRLNQNIALHHFILVITVTK